MDKSLDALAGIDAVPTQAGKERRLRKIPDSAKKDLDRIIVDTPPVLDIPAAGAF